MALNLTHGAFKTKQCDTDTKCLLKSLKCVLSPGNICVFSPGIFQRDPQNLSDQLQPEHWRPAMRRHDIQINAHQSGVPPCKTAESFFFFWRVWEWWRPFDFPEWSPALCCVTSPSLSILLHFSPPARIFDEDPQDWALIACTHSVNNGIVLETLPPSHLPATHAGSLSSISAISFASMRLPRWPKHSRVAAPWRKRGYLLESSRWRSLSLMHGGLVACFCNKVAR